MVSKQVTSSRKEGVSKKLSLKTNEPYKVLHKSTPGSYWLKCLPFCEGLGRLGRKVNQYAYRMKNILFTMVIHKYLDGVDTIFTTMLGPFVNNTM